MKKALFVMVMLLLAACSDEATARRALNQSGFTAVETTGFAPFSCGKDDTFATGFRALGPSGEPVRGAVCSGWFKGATIRFY